jgi:hypothetical protein
MEAVDGQDSYACWRLLPLLMKDKKDKINKRCAGLLSFHKLIIHRNPAHYLFYTFIFSSGISPRPSGQRQDHGLLLPFFSFFMMAAG